MGLRKNILKNYLQWLKLYYIIWHDPFKYIIVIFKYLIFLWILFVSFYYIQVYIKNENYLIFISYIYWILWFILYIFFIVRFMDIYLDCIILTDSWITIFYWNWLFKYNAENLNWKSIDSVYDEQNWLLDIFLNKWMINIKKENEIFKFYDITNPSHKRWIILEYLKKFNYKPEQIKEKDPEKFDVFVETIWDLIIDYMKKFKKI